MAATMAMQYGMEQVCTDVQEALGIDFNLPDPKVFEHLLTSQWHGSNFSSRIWANTQGLAKAAGIVLTDGLTQGRTIAEMAISLYKIVHDGFAKAHRLVRTETMHVLNSASLLSYQDAGITQVEFCAATDERTCEVCGALHGKVYPIAKAIHIPVHPNCRCCWMPVVEKNTLLDKGKGSIMEPTQGKASNPHFAKVWKNGDQSKREYLLAVDSQGREIAENYCKTMEVGMPDELIAILKTAEPHSIDIYNNHPSSQSFSDDALVLVCRYKAIRSLKVVGRDGTEYSMDSVGAIKSQQEVLDCYQKHEKATIQSMHDALAKQIRDKAITGHQANKIISDTIICTVAKEFGWKYNWLNR
ncbi:minor capsid protein, partial [Eubacterium aggregans]